MFGVKKLDFDLVTTRNGDRGASTLYGGGAEVRKDDLVFECVGELDYVNSLLGQCKAKLKAMQQRTAVKFIDSVQTDFIAISALIATNRHTEDGKQMYEELRQITDKDVHRLEKYQKKLLNDVEIKPVFVNPGETMISALLDVARSQTRTAERRIVSVIRDKVRTDLYKCQNYINRLSDVLFVMARFYGQGFEEADD